MKEQMLPARATKEGLQQFAELVKGIQQKIGFKISSRGWCYQLENEGYINKGQFDRVENLINECRKKGILPIDFTAEEEGRQFSGVEIPNTDTPVENMRTWIEYLLRTETFGYTPDWWDGEKYYIQMLVEKIDLKTLFEPVCKRFHIPIATSKGWSSMLQRAIYALRFKQAEDRGIKPLLLYCGDHDADGLKISDFIRINLEDLQFIMWDDGQEGYNPDGLEILRFGLNYDFIEEHKLTWINNLITGSGKNLADPNHKNYRMPYVQEYIKTYGIRKCEANAIVPYPVIARKLVEDAIIRYIGSNAEKRFAAKTKAVKEEIQKFRTKTKLDMTLRKALDLIDKGEE